MIFGQDWRPDFILYEMGLDLKFHCLRTMNTMDFIGCWWKANCCCSGCHVSNLAVSAPSLKFGGLESTKKGESGFFTVSDICLFHGKGVQSTGCWKFLDNWRETLIKLSNGWISSLPVFRSSSKGFRSGEPCKYLLCFPLLSWRDNRG